MFGFFYRVSELIHPGYDKYSDPAGIGKTGSSLGIY